MSSLDTMLRATLNEIFPIRSETVALELMDPELKRLRDGDGNLSVGLRYVVWGRSGDDEPRDIQEAFCVLARADHLDCPSRVNVFLHAWAAKLKIAFRFDSAEGKTILEWLQTDLLDNEWLESYAEFTQALVDDAVDISLVEIDA